MLADWLLGDWTLGWPLESVDAYAGTLTSVKLEEVNAALADCARGMVAAFKGDARAIASALATKADRESR